MKSLRGWLRIACACTALTLVARGAEAQSSSEDEAEGHMQRGLDYRRTGNDSAALAEFERAETLAPSPRVHAQMGFALQALGRWREAEPIELQVLSYASDPWVREHEDLLRESLATVQHHLGWLLVECNVSGAQFYVNGMFAGQLPMFDPLRVVSGAVVFQVRATGYEPVLRTIDVPAGTRARESVVLVASAPGPSTAVAATVVSSDPVAVRRAVGWAAIVVGGALAAGGVTALAVGAQHLAQYNDDARCFIPPLTRDQRCGADRGVVEATNVGAVVSLSAAGLAVATGIVLVAMAPSRPGANVGAINAVACGAGPWSLGCSGSF
jgi:hypothetical protein